MAASPFIAGGPRRAAAAFVAIVPDNASNQATPFSQLMAAGAGTVSIVDSQGNVASLTLAASVIYDIPTSVRVNVAGTTATGLVGFA